MREIRLTSLKGGIAQAVWELAIKLSRISVKVTQPSGEIRGKLRAAYGQDMAPLKASLQVIATNVQPVPPPTTGDAESQRKTVQ